MKGLWVKLSVDFLDDPKIAAAGVLGEALFIRGLAWAKKANTATIPGVMLGRLGTGIPEVDTLAMTLCELGLWRYDEANDAYGIVAWDAWQTDPAKATAGSIGNHRRWHTGKIVPGCDYCVSEPVAKKPAVAAPAEKPDPVVADEAKQLCEVLAELMVRNGCRRPTITPAWLRDMDALNRLDGHEWRAIEAVLRWSQDDPFWKSNILSPSKFRKQFERLKIKAIDAGIITSAGAPKKEAVPQWEADPECVFCRGEGWVSREDEVTFVVEYAACHCRKKVEA